MTARAKCYESKRQNVTPTQNAKLTEPPTLQELCTAVKDLPAGKAAGADGVPMEFFKELFDDIKQDLLALLSKLMQTCTQCQLLNASKICLLPISGDLTQITNYRSISLLGSVNKILAKFFANRMIPFFPDWIKNPKPYL